MESEQKAFMDGGDRDSVRSYVIKDGGRINLQTWQKYQRYYFNMSSEEKW